MLPKVPSSNCMLFNLQLPIGMQSAQPHRTALLKAGLPEEIVPPPPLHYFNIPKMVIPPSSREQAGRHEDLVNVQLTNDQLLRRDQSQSAPMCCEKLRLLLPPSARPLRPSNAFIFMAQPVGGLLLYCAILVRMNARQRKRRQRRRRRLRYANNFGRPAPVLRLMPRQMICSRERLLPVLVLSRAWACKPNTSNFNGLAIG